MADDHAVADIGPGGLAHQPERHPLLLCKAFLLGGNKKRRVDERQKSGDNISQSGSCHRRNSHSSSNLEAVTRLCAISAILRFWFIAVLRKST